MQALKSFVENLTAQLPNTILPKGLLLESGMFCFTAGVMAENMASHANNVWAASEVTFADAKKKEMQLVAMRQTAQPDISIDYAVMEKLKKSPW